MNDFRKMRNQITTVKSELALRKMRSDINRMQDVASVAPGVSQFTCRIPVNNAGEARATVMFPYKFSHLPTVNFGFELYSSYNAGKMPVFAGSVDEWISIDRLPGSRMYTGAILLISSEAAEDIAFVTIATFSGLAYGGPTDRIIS